MRFSYDESEIKKIQKICKDAKCEYDRSSKTLEGSLISVISDSKNKRMLDVVESLMKGYNDWLAGKFHDTVMDSWEQSFGSFSDIARRTGAGDAAVKEGMKIQGEIRRIVDISKTFSLPEKTNTSEPELAPEYYDMAVDACDQYCKDLLSAETAMHSAIGELGNENGLARCVEGVLATIFVTAREYWDKNKKHLEEEKSLYIQAVKNNQHKIEENDASMVRKATVMATTDSESFREVRGGKSNGIREHSGNSQEDPAGDTEGLGTGEDRTRETSAGRVNANSDGTDGAQKRQIPESARKHIDKIIRSTEADEVRGGSKKAAEKAKKTISAIGTGMGSIAGELVDSFGDPKYYKVIRDMALLMEAYMLFGRGHFKTGSKWNGHAEYEYDMLYNARNGRYFSKEDRERFQDGIQNPDIYDTIFRLIRNQCDEMADPSDIMDAVNGAKNIISEDLDLDEDRSEELPDFTESLMDLLERVKEGEDISPEEIEELLAKYDGKGREKADPEEDEIEEETDEQNQIDIGDLLDNLDPSEESVNRFCDSFEALIDKYGGVDSIIEQMSEGDFDFFSELLGVCPGDKNSFQKEFWDNYPRSEHDRTDTNNSQEEKRNVYDPYTVTEEAKYFVGKHAERLEKDIFEMSSELNGNLEKCEKHGSGISNTLGVFSEVIDIVNGIFGDSGNGDSGNVGNPYYHFFAALDPNVDELNTLKHFCLAGVSPVTYTANGILKIIAKINDVGKKHRLGKRIGDTAQKFFSNRKTKKFMKKYNEDISRSVLAKYLIDRQNGVSGSRYGSYSNIAHEYMKMLNATNEHEKMKLEATICAVTLYGKGLFDSEQTNGRIKGTMLNSFCAGLAYTQIFESSNCVAYTNVLTGVLENDRELSVGNSKIDLSAYIGRKPEGQEE